MGKNRERKKPKIKVKNKRRRGQWGYRTKDYYVISWKSGEPRPEILDRFYLKMEAAVLRWARAEKRKKEGGNV
jgi:hypothetical protein